MKINRSLFEATTIQLTALNAQEDAPTVAAWTEDSRYIPLVVDAAPRPLSAIQAEKMLEGLLKEAGEKEKTFWFGIRTPDEKELLGVIGLNWVQWSNGIAFMTVNMKDFSEYARPTTEEALLLMLRYTFSELQLHRLSTYVPAYNEGLVATLQSLGFVEEIRRREALYRFGRRWDGLSFGLLAADWRE